MPPYSAQNDYTTDEVYAFPQSLKKTDESVDISPPALTLTPSTDSHDSSVLTNIMCGGLPTNPFKHRTCAECGGACSKFQGYRKELVPAMAASNTTLFDEDESVGPSQDKDTTTMKKQYYHKRCYQVKQDRDAHKVTSGLVTVVLPEFMDYLQRQEAEKTRVARQAELEATAELERLAALLSVGVHKTTPPRTSTKHVLRASLVKIKNGFAKTSLLARKKQKKTKQPQPVVVWQEYTDPASGNPYWSSDGVTTTWDKPTTGSIRAYEL